MEALVAQQLLEANKLIFVRAYEEAQRKLLGVIEGAGSVFSADLLLHLRYIELMIMLGRHEELTAFYERVAIAQAPEGKKISDIASALARQMADKCTPQESMTTLQELLKVYGADPAIYFGMAISMEALGNFERAQFNYEETLRLDNGWYPAYFGLSQIHYAKSDDSKGDQFFFQFESLAPFNVYGNFETHKSLAREFLGKKQYPLARIAIETLAGWWLENKGFCPSEVQIFQYLILATVDEAEGEKEAAQIKKESARVLTQSLLAQENPAEHVLFFLAAALEEAQEKELALRCYQALLTAATVSPASVQKIGGHFLTAGDPEQAEQIFQRGYETHPDHAEIRFCLLVSRLKNEKVHVEEYLLAKERLKQLVESSGDRVELLALLHSMLQKFGRDPEVHFHLAEIYQRMGNDKRARVHLDKMRELDPLSRVSCIRYAHSLLQVGDADGAMAAVEQLTRRQAAQGVRDPEVDWVRATYFSRQREYSRAQEILKHLLLQDPWNISYVLQEIVVLTAIHQGQEQSEAVDVLVKTISAGRENEVSWSEFDQETAAIDKDFHVELSYARHKLRFLYDKGSFSSLKQLTAAAVRFDAAAGAHDFIRLLNTNFDGPHIYWGLGFLFKELWQLETASMWFEQGLLAGDLSKTEKARFLIELADCYTWRNVHLNKASEYIKFAMDLGSVENERAAVILAHALLRMGQAQQARIYLEQLEKISDLEASYLTGLVYYRNGTTDKAKTIWKPLLKARAETLRHHHVKQELMRYYYDAVPYQPRDLTKVN